MPKKLKKNLKEETKSSELAKLLTEDASLLAIPQVGQAVTGTVLTATNKEVRIDIAGYGTGVVRGPGLYMESPDYADLKPGDVVEATVNELENENGELELSFRSAGHKKVWDILKKLVSAATIIQVEIIDANRGGLMIKVNKINGFLPVSQLSPEHYPRVQGGDKNKILEKLKSYVHQKFDVKVITADEEEEKLIVSEKAAWEEQQHSTLAKYQIGDLVEGKVTAVTDFGAFVEFGEKLEGLIHISELAWQRIDDPKDFIKVGQAVKAKIINVQGSKIFLSTKALIDDPWKNVKAKYQVGQLVKGKVLKANPFGLFVELDPEIHGLAHISELSDKPIEDISEIAKPGDAKEFYIVSIEPENHRLGLSFKAPKDKSDVVEATEKKPAKTRAKKIKEPKAAKTKEEKAA
ncbi:MAG: S1 RNA-binding domain-containing protein [Candidatus Parcubacteria bacterium]|nr:S1 RNA-binding domain-containing protein [Candidatus Parcubacteria bacterium]